MRLSYDVQDVLFIFKLGHVSPRLLIRGSQDGCFPANLKSYFKIILKLIKAMFNFKVYDVTGWTRNNYNTHIAQYIVK